LWWIGVFTGVFAELWVLDVVFLWWLRGNMCGEGGQEDVTFGAESSATFSRLFCWHPIPGNEKKTVPG
jgi:hypothetical protein